MAFGWLGPVFPVYFILNPEVQSKSALQTLLAGAWFDSLCGTIASLEGMGL